MSGTSGAEEAEQIKVFKDFLANYNKLSEICFTDCVWDFTSRTVSKGEDSCSQNCAEKYLKMNQRISTRFQEFQMMANESAINQMTKNGTL